MVATIADAEQAIQAAIIKVQALGEIPNRPVVIDTAVKRLMMADTEEADARDLVARAVTAMRQRGVLHAHEGPYNIWTITEAGHA
ncbi:hypothetical protein [Zavarzinia compransoris]|uniref:Uncharacterized protein n=1 Tax=Zavarzinia compransoris TaxID=1264899 RepID=A0A317DTJ9_9PROT|nr:hypothetical protein [Zavarzinia compransoris]PWR17999.1 hypothetical protein DKG75_20890 [Zavarzinia compransoris]TDP43537.1 hypothetical protein DES42_111105 [Zavarzinia compransoris]